MRLLYYRTLSTLKKDQAMTNQGSSTDNNTQQTAGPRILPPPDGASDVLRDSVASNPELVLERMKQFENVPQNEAE